MEEGGCDLLFDWILGIAAPCWLEIRFIHRYKSFLLMAMLTCVDNMVLQEVGIGKVLPGDMAGLCTRYNLGVEIYWV